MFCSMLLNLRLLATSAALLKRSYLLPAIIRPERTLVLGRSCAPGWATAVDPTTVGIRAIATIVTHATASRPDASNCHVENRCMFVRAAQTERGERQTCVPEDFERDCQKRGGVFVLVHGSYVCTFWKNYFYREFFCRSWTV